jgi:hypothetical protein
VSCLFIELSVGLIFYSLLLGCQNSWIYALQGCSLEMELWQIISSLYGTSKCNREWGHHFKLPQVMLNLWIFSFLLLLLVLFSYNKWIQIYMKFDIVNMEHDECEGISIWCSSLFHWLHMPATLLQPLEPDKSSCVQMLLIWSYYTWHFFWV